MNWMAAVATRTWKQFPFFFISHPSNGNEKRISSWQRRNSQSQGNREIEVATKQSQKKEHNNVDESGDKCRAQFNHSERCFMPKFNINLLNRMFASPSFGKRITHFRLPIRLRMRTARALDYIHMLVLGRVQQAWISILSSLFREFISISILLCSDILYAFGVRRIAPRLRRALRISMEYEGYVEHKNKLVIIIVPCVRECVCVCLWCAHFCTRSRISFPRNPCASIVRRMACDEYMEESHEKIMSAFFHSFIARVYFNRMRMHNKNGRSRE